MPSRRNSAACMLLAAASMGFAQPQAPPADEKPASLEGEVRNAVSGMPVERAHVSLRRFVNNGTDKFGALTNAEGKFSITSIPAGMYQVSLDRVGFVVPLEVSRTQMTLKPGDKKDGVKLKLIPVGAISGRVLDSDGQPMDGIAVQAEQLGRMVRNAATDDRGQFRIGGLSPGKYRVRAVPQSLPFPPEIRTDGTTEIFYSATYHPGAVAVQDSTRVQVGAASDVTGVDIRMVRAPIIRIAGKVSGFPEGAKNIFVQLRAVNGVQTSSGGLVKPDGSFEIWRPNPGRYMVSAALNSSGEVLQSGAVEVDVGDSDVENIGLMLMAPEDLRGQLNFDDEEAKQGPPAPSVNAQRPPGTQGASSQAPPPRPPRRIQLREAFGMGQTKLADVSEDGSFIIPKVTPGKFMVVMQGYRGFVKSTRLGEVAKDGVLLDLSRGSGGAALTVTLSSAFAEISGTVQDDKGPAAGARVMLSDTVGIGAVRYTAITSADGTYTLKSLAPGSYKLMVIDEGEMHTMTGEPNMDDYDERAEPLEVRPKDTLTRDLKVRPLK